MTTTAPGKRVLVQPERPASAHMQRQLQVQQQGPHVQFTPTRVSTVHKPSHRVPTGSGLLFIFAICSEMDMDAEDRVATRTKKAQVGPFKLSAVSAAGEGKTATKVFVPVRRNGGVFQ